jgi:hypothetical protein
MAYTPCISVLPPGNIQESIRDAPIWKQHIIQYFLIYDVDVFTKCLLENADTTIILMVSDGGLKNGIGSFSVAIATPRFELCRLEGPAPGNAELLTPFRAEAYGMHAGIVFLHKFVSSHKIIISTPRKILLHCDNIALVKWIDDMLYDVSYPRMFIKSEQMLYFKFSTK